MRPTWAPDTGLLCVMCAAPVICLHVCVTDVRSSILNTPDRS